jgi:hydroxymethylglutaryl-CoA lyase
MAHPGQVASLCRAFRARFPEAAVTLHLHNTRGMGLANALAGLGEGIDRFDASLGGLGGCPYAPGATGNICTEDLVHMLQAMELAMDVDLAGLLAAARVLPGMVGHEVPGQVLRAGRSQDLHPVPANLAEIRARAEALA